VRPITVSQSIHASPALVFEVVATPEVYGQAIPAIVRTDLLSSTTHGVGTRFRSVRIWKKRETSTDLEITEFVLNSRVRMIAESNSTVWDTTYIVTPHEDHSDLTITMAARSDHAGRRLLNFLIRGMMAAALRQDLLAVKSYCEAHR
jgi:hypothetical protein